jgi:hypothetical protein
MIRVPTLPKMLYTPTGFYCTSCDYYFTPELDRSGLPDCPVRWLGIHKKVERLNSPPCDCPLEGKMFEIDVTRVFPEAKEV